MPRGGKRPGAGRKPGGRNKATLAEKKAIEESGLSPLDYMLSVMRNSYNDLEARLSAAKAAAPYVHRALKSTEHSGPDGSPIKTVGEMVISFD